MPNTKTTKRRGSGGSPALGPSQKVPRTSEKNNASGASTTGDTTLDHLSKLSTIVADSADFEAIKEFSPTDATTNPTLVLQAVKNPKYKHILEKAVKETQEVLKGKSADAVSSLPDRCAPRSEVLILVHDVLTTVGWCQISFREGGFCCRW